MSYVGMSVKPTTHYVVECLDREGNVKWLEEFDNIVVTAGLNKVLDATLKTGLTTPAWYVGLKGAGTVLAADTMASHSGWTEVTAYTGTDRPTFTPGTIAAGSVDNSASKAVFSINGTTTVVGCFLSSIAPFSPGNTGTLYGGGDFSVSRSVASGDTLNVQMTMSVS